MRPDPEPRDSAGGFDTYRPVIFADASDPIFADLLKMQGRVPVVVPPEAIGFVSELPDLRP